MYLTFLVICLSLYIANSERDVADGKYIDLLPEEEKQEFLNRIARRIWDEVKSKKSPVEDHVEINEEQLDAQNEYVQRLLREERENLRRFSKGKHNASNEDNKAKYENFYNEGQRLKENDDDSNKKKFIDLTIRGGRRTKRGNDDYKVIPVKTVYEEKPASAVNAKGESNGELSDKEDIQVRNLRKSGEDEQVTGEKPINIETTTANNLSAVPFESTELKLKEAGSLEFGVKGLDNTTIESVNAKRNETESTQNINASDTSLIKEANDTVADVINFANSTLHSSVENSAGEEISIVTATELTTKNSNQEEITASIVATQNVSNSNVANGVTEKVNIEVNANDNQTNISPSIEVTEALTESAATIIPNEMESYSKTPENLVIEYSTAATSVPSTINSHEETKENKSQEVVSKKYVTTPSTVSKLIDKSEDFDIIKFNANFNVSFSQISKGRLNTDGIHVIKSTNGLGGYEVHEIPPGQPPFIPISNVKIPPATPEPRYEESHYIPIYNYAAKNAYFHPHNRFDKNHEDRDEAFINLVSVNRNRDSMDRHRPPRDSMDMDYYYMKEKKEDDYSHADSKSSLRNVDTKPNDSVVSKLETDYYFSRVGAKTDKSDYESKISERPSYLGDTLKSHLTAVRSSLRNIKNVEQLENNQRSVLDMARLKDEDELKKSPKYLGVPDDKYLSDNPDEYETVEIYSEDDYRFDKPRQETSEKSDALIWSRDDNEYNDEYVENRSKNDYGFKDSERNTYTSVKLVDLIRKGDDNDYVKIQTENDYESEDPKLTFGAKLKQLINNYDSDKYGTVGKIKSYRAENVLNAQNYFLNYYFDRSKALIEAKHSSNNGESDEIKNAGKSKSNDTHLEAFLNVLKDMIATNNRALQQYDWLGTTVDIQAALQKLALLIEKVQNGERIHPSDWQLLKYIAYLYKSVISSSVETSASQQDEEEEEQEITDPIVILLMPKKEGKREHRIINSRRNCKDVDELLEGLADFVAYVQDGLYRLHTAIKEISSATKYNQQKWFQSLKRSYFKTPTRRQLLELLLHLFTLNLLEIIEASSTNGVESNYIAYIEQNKREVERTVEEFGTVNKLLEELKKL